MDDIKLRSYQDNDFSEISRMFEDFIDYIAGIDPMSRIIKQPDYGKNYLSKTLQEIKDKNGCFIIAEIEKTIVGYGVAVVGKLDKNDLMEVLPHVPGRVTELYVTDQYRGKGIGTKIMEQLEIYLKTKKCDTIHIEVFAPNSKTHKLYDRLGYTDRNIDMLKLL